MLSSELISSLIDEILDIYESNPLFILDPAKLERVMQIKHFAHVLMLYPAQGRKLRKCHMRRIYRRVRQERKRYGVR